MFIFFIALNHLDNGSIKGLASENESDIFVVLGASANQKSKQTLAEKKKAADENDKDAPK